MKDFSKRKPISEKQLQKKIVQLIDTDELYDAIKNKDYVFELAEHNKRENELPVFSIDHLVRMTCVEAAAHGLSSLSNLVILTDDANVSITAGEALRPDIICFNPEGEKIVLFELKKSSQVGRQALTELIAYEQELKNQLPFLANYETIFVLVSAEWSTLMDHSAASSITWSSHQLLCLEALIENRKLILRPRLPSAWHVTASSHFPQRSLPCVTLCLYNYEPSEKAKGNIDARLATALNLIAREGDKIGGHGFALVWRDHLSISQASYNITVCGVAPFAFYKKMRERGVISPDQGELIGPLDDVLSEHDPQGHSESLFRAVDIAKPILAEISDPQYEGFSDWETTRASLMTRAEPLFCDFWGILGDFVRHYTTHPAIRKHNARWFNDGQSDWRTPHIGIPLLESFLARDIFPDGNVRCSDCFKLGVALGLDFVLRRNFKDSEGPRRGALYCRILWSFYELLAIADEINLLTNAAENVSAPETPFVLSNNPEKDVEKENEAALEWLMKDFLQNSPAHLLFLDIGLNGAVLFDPALSGGISSELKKNIGLTLDPMLRTALLLILSLLAQLKAEGGLSKEHRYALKYLIKTLNIKRLPAKRKIESTVNAIAADDINYALPQMLSLADMLIDAVFHKHAKTSPTMPDWDWLKQGIEEMYQRGEKYPAIHLLANGTLVTGPIDREGIEWMKPIKDTKKEVVFCDHSHGIMVALNTTWDALKGGKHFPVG